MAGINLSQSIKEKQAIAQGRMFDRGFFINVVVFLVVIGLYGGSHWYLGSVEEQYTALQSDLLARKASGRNADSNAVADFQVRLATMRKGIASNPDPKAAFDELEQLTLPSIRLTGYRWLQSDKELNILGVTTSLKSLAQQMLSYKKAGGVAAVHVVGVKYNDAGEIEFELRLPMTSEPVESAS
jgi:hypothetical protein